MTTAAVVLAAGGSRRLGRPKQLVELDGEPLVRRAARIAQEAGCWPVVVVLGAEERRCRAALAGLEVHVVVNARWAEGMGISLRAGIAALEDAGACASGAASRDALSDPGTCSSAETGRPEAALVMTVDQVHLRAEDLSALLALRAGTGMAIAAARYGGRLGVPAVFARSLWGELAELRGDTGARGLLLAHAEQVAALELAAAEVDLDTPEDLSKLG